MVVGSNPTSPANMNLTGPEINGEIQKDLKYADVTLTDCKSVLPYQIGVLDSGSKGVRISPAALANFTCDSTFPTG